MNKEKYLLVDGYNIIFAWKELKILANRELEHARKKLMDILSNFQGYTKENVILVFDAQKVNHGIETIENYDNIVVVYTKEKETADMYIEKTSKKLSKNYNVRVATSDNLEQVIIIGHGSYRLSANDLYEEIKNAKKDMEKKYKNDNKIKNNMLISNLDFKTAKMLENMRMQKGE